MQYILATDISKMRRELSRLETSYILFARFQTNTVYYPSFLDRLALLVGLIKIASPPNTLSTDTIQLEEVKAHQSNGGELFTLSVQGVHY
jgi:hypothetical protein